MNILCTQSNIVIDKFLVVQKYFMFLKFTVELYKRKKSLLPGLFATDPFYFQVYSRKIRFMPPKASLFLDLNYFFNLIIDTLKTVLVKNEL